jgi:hypothetical protein
MSGEKSDINEKEPITFVSDRQCQIDLWRKPNPMRWHRFQKRYKNIMPPKIPINGIPHRMSQPWERCKQHLIEIAASAEPDPVTIRNLERGRQLGREKQKERIAERDAPGGN